MRTANQSTAIETLTTTVAERVRSRILYCLLDGYARTQIELVAAVKVSPHMVSAQLSHLLDRRLVRISSADRYRYYSLQDPRTVQTLKSLAAISGVPPDHFVPTTPARLRTARTCYDHMAGSLAVGLHDRMLSAGWLTRIPDDRGEYRVTDKGTQALKNLGIDPEAARRRRRRFAYACLDWSERRPHLAGALGAALLQLAVQRKWVVRDLDSRALRITPAGRNQMRRQFGLQI